MIERAIIAIAVYAFMVFCCWMIVEAFFTIGDGGGDPKNDNVPRHGPF